MYFDEIYHGRTAYEFVHGLTSYENVGQGGGGLGAEVQFHRLALGHVVGTLRGLHVSQVIEGKTGVHQMYKPSRLTYLCYGGFSILHFYNTCNVLFFYDPASTPRAKLT